MKEVKSPKKPLIYYYSIILLIVLLFNLIVSPLLMKNQVTEVDYGTFMRMIEEKNIGEVEVEDDEILFTDKDKQQVYTTGAMDDPTLTQRLYDSGATFTKEIQKTMSPVLSFVLTAVLPLVIFIAIGQYMGKKLVESAGGKNSLMFGGTGKSGAKVYVQSTQGIHFEDVAGEDEAKESLAEIVDYLHNPQKYTDVGASMPKGVLLVGPPGTGKTMLAKAVAGEANVPFFSMSGSEFVEMFVGMGASKVRDLFKQAKEKAPCIVFIDEIDAIGKKRDNQLSSNDEREQTLNQLLTEMDGFEGNNGVIILAATNRPESLDPALTRPGRFDRRVPVELPDLAGREAILKVHAKKIKTADDVDFHTIARMASGASGAELANMINEAALRAVRNHRTVVTEADLEESIEVVIAGYQKKNAVLSDHEKQVVSYHEIGHALVAALQTHSAPVQKITIIPRTSGALGYTMQVDTADKNLMTKEEIENKIATFTGGRAAEEVVFGEITTGASNDFERATQMARDMVMRYGMSDRLGPMVYSENEGEVFLGRSVTKTTNISEKTMQEVDAEVRRIIDEQYAIARRLIEENRDKMEVMAKALLDWETIDADQIDDIMEGRAPRPPKTSKEAVKPEAAQAAAPEGEAGAAEEPKAEDAEAPAAPEAAGAKEASSSDNAGAPKGDDDRRSE